MRFVFIFGLVCIIFFSCSTVQKRRLSNVFRSTEEQFNDHTGFLLFDPSTKKELFSFNADKYFTPASNTKIFTFYAALKILDDSIPALRFTTNNDSLIFWGTGD